MIYNGYEIRVYQESCGEEGLKWFYDHDIWNCRTGTFNSESEAQYAAIQDINAALEELAKSRYEYNEPSSEYLDNSWNKTQDEF